jgi:hypothetical protein
MAQCALNFEGFWAVLIGPDSEVLDKKLWSSEAAAIKWATSEGPGSVEGDVVKAEIYSSENELVWFRSNIKIEIPSNHLRYRFFHHQDKEAQRNLRSELKEIKRLQKLGKY